MTRQCRSANGRVLRGGLLAVTLAMAGCVSTETPTGSVPAQTGLVPVAFESISGAPQPVFERLIAELSRESEARRVLLVSRNEPAEYRVRAYLAAHAEGADGQVAWVFDVFDGSRRRVVRLSGEQPAGGEPWSAGSDAVVASIAAQGMAELSQWLRTAAPAGQVAQAGPAPAEAAPSASLAASYAAD